MAEPGWIAKQFESRAVLLIFKYSCNITWSDGEKNLKVIFSNAVSGSF